MENSIESDYDLEIERAIVEIHKTKAKLVCLQLPDGLKQLATDISRELKEKTGAEIFIWFGTCFGACDIPTLPKEFDLLIQWGHTEWKQQ